MRRRRERRGKGEEGEGIGGRGVVPVGHFDFLLPTLFRLIFITIFLNGTAN